MAKKHEAEHKKSLMEKFDDIIHPHANDEKVNELLADATEEISKDPAASVKSQSKKSSNPKDFRDHSKFDKFKKGDK